MRTATAPHGIAAGKPNLTPVGVNGSTSHKLARPCASSSSRETTPDDAPRHRNLAAKSRKTKVSRPNPLVARISAADSVLGIGLRSTVSSRAPRTRRVLNAAESPIFRIRTTAVPGATRSGGVRPFASVRTARVSPRSSTSAPGTADSPPARTTTRNGTRRDGLPRTSTESRNVGIGTNTRATVPDAEDTLADVGRNPIRTPTS